MNVMDNQSVAALMKAGNAVAQAHYFLGLATIDKMKDTESGEDLAIEHFMEERQKLREQLAQADDVLLEVTRYATQLQEKLNTFGIHHSADPYTGRPRVTFNLKLLEEGLREAIERS